MVARWAPGLSDEGGLLAHRDVGRAFALVLRALDVEEVADSLEGPDPARLARRRAELAANAADPDAQVLQVVAVLRPPDLCQQLGVEDDLAGVRGQVLQEQPLGP